MLKISAFYVVKQKSFIPKKCDLSQSQYQIKKALFTDPIFSDGSAIWIKETPASKRLVCSVLDRKFWDEFEKVFSFSDFFLRGLNKSLAF